jgi:hypothetical protein
VPVRIGEPQLRSWVGLACAYSQAFSAASTGLTGRRFGDALALAIHLSVSITLAMPQRVEDLNAFEHLGIDLTAGKNRLFDWGQAAVRPWAAPTEPERIRTCGASKSLLGGMVEDGFSAEPGDAVGGGIAFSLRRNQQPGQRLPRAGGQDGHNTMCGDPPAERVRAVPRLRSLLQNRVSSV